MCVSFANWRTPAGATCESWAWHPCPSIRVPVQPRASPCRHVGQFRPRASLPLLRPIIEPLPHSLEMSASDWWRSQLRSFIAREWARPIEGMPFPVAFTLSNLNFSLKPRKGKSTLCDAIWYVYCIQLSTYWKNEVLDIFMWAARGPKLAVCGNVRGVGLCCGRASRSISQLSHLERMVGVRVGCWNIVQATSCFFVDTWILSSIIYNWGWHCWNFCWQHSAPIVHCTTPQQVTN